MLEMNVPRDAVARKMSADGLDPKILRLSLDDVSPHSPPGSTLGRLRAPHELYAAPAPLSPRSRIVKGRGGGSGGGVKGSGGGSGSDAVGVGVAVSSSALNMAHASTLLRDLFPLVDALESARRRRLFASQSKRETTKMQVPTRVKRPRHSTLHGHYKTLKKI